MNILKTTLAAAVAATGIAGAAQAADPTAIRCSHQLPPKHHIAQVIDRWAAEVETQSNGSLDVKTSGCKNERMA